MGKPLDEFIEDLDFITARIEERTGARCVYTYEPIRDEILITIGAHCWQSFGVRKKAEYVQSYIDHWCETYETAVNLCGY